MDKLKRLLTEYTFWHQERTPRMRDEYGVLFEEIDGLLNDLHEAIASLDKKDKIRVIIENWEDEPNITENVDEFILFTGAGTKISVIGSHSKPFGLLALNKLKKILQESDWEE